MFQKPANRAFIFKLRFVITVLSSDYSLIIDAYVTPVSTCEAIETIYIH